MVSIAERVIEVLPEAIERVSSGGKMKFDIRSLFYAVRELYLKKWPTEKFYEYNSFTQDFMRKYEKENGKVPNMVRGPRGKYASTDEIGTRYGGDVREGFYMYRGIGNKIIVVEKQGLFDMMIANEFDKRLDCIIMTTQGFTTEAGRDAMIEVEGWGLPVCILHDYDINGVLIKETLARPTKRLDTELNPANMIDVGLNYSVVRDLIDSRGLTPEPVTLSQQDLSKLEGMLERGEIDDEEHEFLSEGRVELNALTPLELLEWLEAKLEELDLWKTVPEQEDLDDKLKKEIDGDLESTKKEIVTELIESVEEKLGLDKVWDMMWKMRSRIEEYLDDEVEDRVGNLDYPELSRDELREKLKEDMLRYWTWIVDDVASKMAEDLTDPLRSEVEDEEEDIVGEAREDDRVKKAETDLQNTMKSYLGVV